MHAHTQPRMDTIMHACKHARQAGVVDTAVKITEGISTTAVAKVVAEPLRLPRYFERDGSMREWSAPMAAAQHTLRTAADGRCTHLSHDMVHICARLD